MTATRRKRDRRDRTPRPDQAAPAAGEARPIVTSVPLPAWKWRTFPVLFALSAGLFFGVWIGSLAGIVASDANNSVPMNVALIGAALLFGGVLSRFATRWMMSRQWIKPRPAKPNRKR